MLIKIKNTMPFFSILVFIGIFVSSPFWGQVDGDNLFDTDQVVDIQLDFPQSDYWVQLVYNYNNIDLLGTEYIPANLTLTDLTGTYTFDSVGIRLKGNSSSGHPGDKKSFKIDFNKYISGQNYDGLKKLNFSNGFKDPTFMREKIFFDISLEHGVPAPRTNYATVSYNGVPWGFYTMVEQIDDQFLDWRILDDDGNLFKAGSNFGGGDGEASLEYLGLDQSLYESAYELKSNEAANDWTDLVEFIDFINNTSDSDFETGLASRLDVGPFLGSVALDNLFSNLDSYTQSARNYYIYHNLSTDKWEWIKWDGNEAFGTYGFMGGLTPSNLDIYYYPFNRPLIERVFAIQSLNDQYTSEICFLLSTVFNPDHLNPIIDNLKELIKDDVYADNNKMYSNTEFDMNIESNISGGGPPGLKSFIQDRYNFLIAEVDCAPHALLEPIGLEEPIVFPNPSSTAFKLAGELDYPLQYIIRAMDGKLVKSNVLKNSTDSIDVSYLEPNVYFLHIGAHAFKVVKK